MCPRPYWFEMKKGRASLLVAAFVVLENMKMKHTKPKLPKWNDTALTNLPVCSKTWRHRDPDKNKGLYLLQYAKTNCLAFEFYAQFKGRPLHFKLGQYPHMTIAEARIAALKIEENLEQQKKEDDKADPSVSAASQWTISQTLAEYIKVRESAPNTVIRYTSEVTRLGWNDRVLTSIQP